MDNNNLFITIFTLLELIEKHFSHRKIIITTHHIGFATVISDYLKKGEKAGNKLLKKTGNYGAYFALFLFVAIPIPGTGAWTGSLIAAMLDIPKKKSIPAIALGVCLAAALMGILSLFFEGLFF